MLHVLSTICDESVQNITKRTANDWTIKIIKTRILHRKYYMQNDFFTSQYNVFFYYHLSKMLYIILRGLLL